MQLLKRISSLKITVKFSLAFGLLVFILIIETIIGYRALLAIRDSSNVILTNAEMQRLALGMSSNWEAAQRLRYAYFLETPDIGVEKAYELYAIPAGSKINEVIRDGATIKRHLALQEFSGSLPGIETDLDLYLSNVSQYAAAFEKAHMLQVELFSTNGLQAQFKEHADQLSSILFNSQPDSDLLTDHCQLRSLENRILIPSQIPSISILNLFASRLSQSIEDSNLETDEKTAAQASLQEYQRLAEEIFSTSEELSQQRDKLDTLNQSIEPVMIELLVLVDREVGIAGIQIDDTLQATLQMMTGGMCFGLLIAVVIGVLLHFTVTRNVIHLTRTAAQFHAGSLEARAQIESQDELGDLAKTFNKMADELETLTAKLRKQANHDPLTGLFNRRYLDETLPRELARATRTGSPISMVMIDLDNFKEINDQHGHAVGDRILIEFGTVLSKKSRMGDVACRFGGDEFLVLLPGAKSKDAMNCVKHWIQRLEEIQVNSRGEKITASISAGIVQWKSGETPQELFVRVDGALYNAKNAGRNNIYMDPET